MFISFEGIEGAGKSTAINYLAGFLQANGLDPLCTREPGGCALGRSLRSLLLDARTRELSSRAELFLFLADRAQHVAEIIRPALEAGQTVLCDRYTDSTLAYQGYGRGLDTEYLHRLNQAATGGLQPELTLLLDLPVRCGLMRAGERNMDRAPCGDIGDEAERQPDRHLHEIVAATAAQHGVTVLHDDADFRTIARHATELSELNITTASPNSRDLD